MAKLFAWLSAASCVKSRRVALSMTHRLTLPYSLDSGVLSIRGAILLADGRMYDGAWVRSPPWQSGGEADRSFAGKAQALFLAARAPVGWLRPIKPPLWCELCTAPSPSCALRLHVAALGRGQRLRVTGFGPLALGGTQLAEAL